MKKQNKIQWSDIRDKGPHIQFLTLYSSQEIKIYLFLSLSANAVYKSISPYMRVHKVIFQEAILWGLL